MLGLNKDVVQLSPYNPQWRNLFEEEKKILVELIGEHIIDIQHIGSTAIAGIAAKPMLDVLIGVKTLEDVKQFDKVRLKEAAIYPLGRVAIEGKVVYAKFSDVEALTKTHVYHIVEYGGDWWQQHTLFRDYLNNHLHVAADYEKLKLELAKKFPTCEKSYADAKKAFVDKVLQLAMKELSVK